MKRPETAKGRQRPRLRQASTRRSKASIARLNTVTTAAQFNAGEHPRADESPRGAKHKEDRNRVSRHPNAAARGIQQAASASTRKSRFRPRRKEISPPEKAEGIRVLSSWKVRLRSTDLGRLPLVCGYFTNEAVTMSRDADRPGDHVQPFPGNAHQQEVRHNCGSDNRADREEPFHCVHGGSVLVCGLADVADQRERAGLKNADRHTGNHEQNHKERERSAHGEQIRIQREQIQVPR